MKPIRVQLSRAKGWRMPPNTVKVDRSTKWGNPFVRHGDDVRVDRGAAVIMFCRLLKKEGCWSPKAIRAVTPTTLADVRTELRGKNLACWCKLGEPCHADVLLRLANEEAKA